MQRVPYRINPKRNMPRHIVIKMAKVKGKERLLKAARENQQIIYKGINYMQKLCRPERSDVTCLK